MWPGTLKKLNGGYESTLNEEAPLKDVS